MSQRIAARFERLKSEKRTGLVSFTMAFDPDRDTSFDILASLPQAGVDIIELGMPFSDPMADGPAIQAAGIRALDAGAKLQGVLEMVKQFRTQDNDTPLVLMGYYNPVQYFGVEAFATAAKDAGVDGLIIVDLPPEEDDQLYQLTTKLGISLIKLVTPTTDEKRLQVILSKASGFIYYVAVAGVTGTKSATHQSIARAVQMIQSQSSLPVVAGFGINTPEDAAAIAQHVDAVVVGSAIVKTLAAKGKKEALEFVSSLAQAIRG